jgi:hypothetical protein
LHGALNCGKEDFAVLTPEEKQRIEDEEVKRIAEEQYRAEVRAKLHQGVPSPDGRFPSRIAPGGHTFGHAKI